MASTYTRLVTGSEFTASYRALPQEIKRAIALDRSRILKYPSHAVVSVSWIGAAVFAISRQSRLPAEREYETFFDELVSEKSSMAEWTLDTFDENRTSSLFRSVVGPTAIGASRGHKVIKGSRPGVPSSRTLRASIHATCYSPYVGFRLIPGSEGAEIMSIELLETLVQCSFDTKMIKAVDEYVRSTLARFM